MVNLFFISKIPKSKVYLVSGEIPLFMLRFKYLFIKKKPLIIQYVVSDYYAKSRHNKFLFKIFLWGAKIVKGVIVPGIMLKEEIEDSLNIPVGINIHYPNTDKFFKFSPDLKSKNVVAIGTDQLLRKGTDKIIEIAKELKDFNFFILGERELLPKKIRKEIKKMPNVFATGFVNIDKYLKKSKYYILPGRYDAGPIAITEVMAAGLIPIVGPNCGGKDLVAQMKSGLVMESINPKEFIEKIKELEKLEDKKIKKLSQLAKKIAQNHTAKKGKKDFRKKFYKLYDEISSQK